MNVKERAGCPPYHSPKMGGAHYIHRHAKIQDSETTSKKHRDFGQALTGNINGAVMWPILISMSCWSKNSDE